MGMYSRITCHAIAVRPGMLTQLRRCLKKHKDGKDAYYYSLVELKGGEVSLEKLDGHKIIGYWYENFCRFLKDIAKYIDGEIALAYESVEEGPAYIRFEGGRVKVLLPNWYEYTPDGLIGMSRQMLAGLRRRHYGKFAKCHRQPGHRKTKVCRLN